MSKTVLRFAVVRYRYKRDNAGIDKRTISVVALHDTYADAENDANRRDAQYDDTGYYHDPIGTYITWPRFKVVEFADGSWHLRNGGNV